ncbi:DUF5996 family protein [Streptomyces sp. NPDC002206]
MLPYEAVAAAADPDRALSEFLHSTYEATAELGGWDRAALEADPHRCKHRWQQKQSVVGAAPLGLRGRKTQKVEERS